MRRLLAATLLAALAGNAAAQSCTPYPETFAQNFYRSSYSFFNESPEQVSGLVAMPLMQQLQAQRECWQRQQAGCGLRYDPWLGTADGSIAPPLRFERESQDGERAVVAMHYAAAGQDRTVRLKLRKSAASGCWQLEDFVTPLGESLSALLKGPAAK
jgi:hypothetical protein